MLSDEGERPKRKLKLNCLVSPPSELYPVFNDSMASSNRSVMNSAFDIKTETPINRQAKTAAKPPRKLKPKKYANVESKVKKMIEQSAPIAPRPVVKVCIPVSLDDAKKIRTSFQRKGSTPNIRPARLNYNERSSSSLSQAFDVGTPTNRKTGVPRTLHSRSKSNQMSVPRLKLQPPSISSQGLIMNEEEVTRLSSKRRGSLDTAKSGLVTGVPSDLYDEEVESLFREEEGVATATVSTVSGSTAINVLDLSS